MRKIRRMFTIASVIAVPFAAEGLPIFSMSFATQADTPIQLK
jgi:hypothetical protein